MGQDDRASGEARGLTRRDLFVAAGKTAAVGTVLGAGAAGAGLAAPAAAAAAENQQGSDAVATGPRDTTAFEFVGRIDQDGDHLNGYGFVTGLAGARDEALFGTAGDRSEASALITLVADATLQGRTIRPAVFVIDAVGELRFYRQTVAGADFATPGSFSAGTLVARFAVTLQDILTVIGPNEGLPNVFGELRQTQAERFSLDGRTRRFGRQGQNLRLTATGHGVRSDATKPQSQLDVAGNAVVTG